MEGETKEAVVDGEVVDPASGECGGMGREGGGEGACTLGTRSRKPNGCPAGPGEQSEHIEPWAFVCRGCALRGSHPGEGARSLQT